MFDEATKVIRRVPCAVENALPIADGDDVETFVTEGREQVTRTAVVEKGVGELSVALDA